MIKIESYKIDGGRRVGVNNTSKEEVDTHSEFNMRQAMKYSNKKKIIKNTKYEYSKKQCIKRICRR